MKITLSFILFLTFFFTLYGSLHYYLYRKLERAFRITPLYNRLTLLFLSVMLVAPIFVNASAKDEGSIITVLLAYTGYMWMGALFLFFFIHLLIDIYRKIIYFSSKIVSPIFLKARPGNKASLLITVIMTTGIMTYGTFEAENIKVEKVVLETEKLPPEIATLRIVQVSDIHLSATNGLRPAQKIVALIKDLHPDLLVSTGDFIDRGLKQKESVAGLFRSIRADYGKYAIPGNHEFYAGVDKATEFTEKAGFTMLRNEGTTPGSLINIAGVDDPTAKRFGIESAVSEDEILRKFSCEKPTILLKHQPRINKKSIGLFDIQLSGHTHNGQIFPFNLVTSLVFPYHNGLFKLDKGSYLYVSSGTGTWGPPVRFLSPPDVTVIEFRKKD